MFNIKICVYLLFLSATKTDTKSDETIERRVINGWPGKLGDVPYQVAFKAQIPGSLIYATFCGGAIIKSREIISAAHCFVDRPNFLQVMFKFGRTEISLLHKYAVSGHLKNRDYYRSQDSQKHGQWRSLKKIYYPKSYHFPHDDIALVLIEKPFIFNAHVNKIPYAHKLIDYKGDCLASGFGRITKTKLGDVLLLARLKLISMRNCNEKFKRNMRRFVCTSIKINDVAKGDSGGPLVCMNTSDPSEVPGVGVLVGIVSGNRQGVASFFTRVSSYDKFIKHARSCTPSVLYNNVLSLIGIQTLFLLF